MILLISPDTCVTIEMKKVPNNQKTKLEIYGRKIVEHISEFSLLKKLLMSLKSTEGQEL